MKNFTQAKTFVRDVLDSTGHGKTGIYPGPELPDVPDDFVVLTRYGGPGLAADGALDEVSWQARCVGKQMDFESAESMADAIDIAFISHHSSRLFEGGPWVVEIRRVGGAPNPLMTDDADRTHFVCSYVASVELALPN